MQKKAEDTNNTQFCEVQGFKCVMMGADQKITKKEKKTNKKLTVQMA